jgi:hypothetical protein
VGVAADNPLTPFTVEDIAVAAAEREAGITAEPRADNIDAAVERLSPEERAEWDRQDALDQARLDTEVEPAELAAESRDLSSGEGLAEAIQAEGQSRPEDTAPAPAALNVWNRYADAVSAGENIGGSEVELLARADEMNLVDAQFVAVSDAAGHHIRAVEVAVDPNTGEQYGQMLNVASFAEAVPAAVLYEQLQSHVEEELLPNYAVADFASHAALEAGSALDWQILGEPELAGLRLDQAAQLPGDEPPDVLVDELIQEYGGVDLSAYEQESVYEYDPEPNQAALDYGLAIREGEDRMFEVGIVKEWDSGSRSGVGNEEIRVVQRFDDLPSAQTLAGELYTLSSDVRDLTGDEIAGWQAMASMVYEIGTANNTLENGQPLFTQAGAGIPEDPFTIQPMDRLFAEYDAISQEQQQIEVSDLEQDQQDVPVISTPGMDIDL